MSLQGFPSFGPVFDEPSQYICTLISSTFSMSHSMTILIFICVITNILTSENVNKVDISDILKTDGQSNNSHQKRYLSRTTSKHYGYSVDENKRKCDIKCEEYREKLSSLTDLRFLSKGQCSISISTRITGGQAVQPGEFPHMVALGWFEKHLKFIHRCGGTLISEKWILTAAHCTQNFLKKRGVARLGIKKLSEIKSGSIIGVVEAIRHPNYRSPRMYGDIALMRLVRSVVFSHTIQPSCLYSRYENAPEMAVASGWGAADFDDEDVQDNLHKVNLEIIDTLQCALAYNTTPAIPHGIVPSMLCAGDSRGGWRRDTCHGDSGGPLQIFNTKICLYEVVGITSFGKLCGTPDFPGVYTRVSHYLDWIESIVWPDIP